MKKSDEIRKEIESLSAKIETLQEAENYSEAAKWSGDLVALTKQLEAAKAYEAMEVKNAQKGAPAPAASGLSEKELARRAFNKLVRRDAGSLTDEERLAYKNVTGSPGQPGQIEAIPAKGGYLVPTEQMSQIADLREEFTQLKNYVTVRPTQYTTGTWPTISDQNLIFQNFVELTDIPEGDISFGQLNYSVADMGLIIPISNQLIDDANADIVDICGRELALAAVRAENADILGKLGTLAGTDGADATTLTSYKQLSKGLFKDLKRTYYNTAKIYTNQSGFLWLAELDDGNNRPLFVPDVTEPDKYTYRGKEIVVIEDSLLQNIIPAGGTDEYAPFFIGDLKSYLWFFERQGMELAISTEYLWRKFGTALRGVIRFGSAVYDADAVKAYKVKLS